MVNLNETPEVLNEMLAQVKTANEQQPENNLLSFTATAFDPGQEKDIEVRVEFIAPPTLPNWNVYITPVTCPADYTNEMGAYTDVMQHLRPADSYAAVEVAVMIEAIKTKNYVFS